MLAAVPVPAVRTPVHGVADVAITCVPRGTGTGDIHTNLCALCMPGTAPVVLAAHVNHCRDKSSRLSILLGVLVVGLSVLPAVTPVWPPGDGYLLPCCVAHFLPCAPALT